LGAPFENGTEDRIRQVGERALAIVRDCFSPRDEVFVLITD